MWPYRKQDLGGSCVFFRLSLGSDSVTNYYTTNWQLMHHHKYSLTEVENWMPWEREIYLMLLMKHLEEENERQKREQHRG